MLIVNNDTLKLINTNVDFVETRKYDKYYTRYNTFPTTKKTGETIDGRTIVAINHASENINEHPFTFKIDPEKHRIIGKSNSHVNNELDLAILAIPFDGIMKPLELSEDSKKQVKIYKMYLVLANGSNIKTGYNLAEDSLEFADLEKYFSTANKILYLAVYPLKDECSDKPVELSFEWFKRIKKNVSDDKENAVIFTTHHYKYTVSLQFSDNKWDYNTKFEIISDDDQEDIAKYKNKSLVVLDEPEEKMIIRPRENKGEKKFNNNNNNNVYTNNGYSDSDKKYHYAQKKDYNNSNSKKHNAGYDNKITTINTNDKQTNRNNKNTKYEYTSQNPNKRPANKKKVPAKEPQESKPSYTNDELVYSTGDFNDGFNNTLAEQLEKLNINK